MCFLTDFYFAKHSQHCFSIWQLRRSLQLELDRLYLDHHSFPHSAHLRETFVQILSSDFDCRRIDHRRFAVSVFSIRANDVSAGAFDFLMPNVFQNY
jgi:hypothetical protein